ncbi:cerebellar degeneration-related protein 2 isoform X2 [Dunckerocampus dactyliophorus]|uniref:cerebellar degeneration-related protein 2 isoform X2 n=1 Tax=Dunckerocampus dactyliophorus TaxID=161453 RepID=UPI002405E7BA|nr:cerebellar degeneration-related protein 2 isoform X2 [Dunckerocampus dactyliophorus]
MPYNLHLAAKLGKTLLDRNRELEQGLQQMYSTNQEQLLEIEFLARQVELLRQMNDQHAKVYETLDLSTRDLERSNQRLAQDNRLAQNKINSLTDSIDGLQTHAEDLQNQVEALMSAQAERNKQGANIDQRRNLGAQSVSCLKELHDVHHDRCISNNRRQTEEPRYDCDPEEERATLLRSVQTLQGQLAAEKSLREAVERENEFTAKEKLGLEQRLGLLGASRARQMELEARVEQMRLLWRADCADRNPDQLLLLPDTMFFTSEKKPKEGQGETEEAYRHRPRRNSDGSAREMSTDDHDRMCVRRAEVVKQRGISLLNEVDAQYNALQVKYDELLQKCQQASVGLTHKSVQTSCSPSAGNRPHRHLSSSTRELTMMSEEPEYKVLFKEIFTCIQKTKEDLNENRLLASDSSARM